MRSSHKKNTIAAATVSQPRRLSSSSSFFFFLRFVLLLLTVITPSSVQAQSDDLDTLQEVIAGQNDLSTLAIVLEQAGFYNGNEFDNAQSDPVTLCSPNNAAFDKLPPNRLTQLLEKQFVGHLRDVLEFHGVPGKVFAENVTNGLVAPTLNDEELTFDFVTDTATNQTSVFIRTPNTEGSQVVEVNLEASNGIAHKIDALLLPDFWDKNLVAVINSKLSTDTYSIFQELMEMADEDIQSALTNFTGGTVLAPSNSAILDAFGGADGVDTSLKNDALERASFLKRHMIPNIVLPSRNIVQNINNNAEDNTGSSSSSSQMVTNNLGETILVENPSSDIITFNGVVVMDVDELANNGLIHGIESVILPEQGGLGTLQDVIASQNDLSTLAIALDKAGFYNGEEFDNANADPVTLCSPNNDAFDKLPTGRLDQLFEQQFVLHLRDVLEFHGVPGKVFAENVTNGLVAPTLNDQELTFDFVTDTATNQTSVFIRTPNTEGSQVVEVNLEASNGIAHKIDALLLPDFWDKNLVAVIDQKLSTDTYSIFQELMAQADSDIQSTLTNFTGGTVLAPSNTAMLDAFGGADGIDALKASDSANELTTFLQRHIIPNDVLASINIVNNTAAAPSMTATNANGEEIFIASSDDSESSTSSISFNGVNVVDFDQLANNGLIHGIDGVIMEPVNLGTLKDVIEAENDLTTLAQVLEQAGFYDGEKFDNANSSPVTLCSPNNAAFSKIPSDRFIQLLDEQYLLHLRDVIEFHGVPGKVFAENVTNGLIAPTLNDEQLLFDFVTENEQTSVFIRTPNTVGSQVVEVNLEASNGIAHKIDALLLPDFWDKNLMEVIEKRLANDTYSIFQELMAEADSDIQSTLSNFAGGTVLAPSNTAMLDAFGGQAGVDALKGAEAALERATFLEQHIIPSDVLASINIVNSESSSMMMTATNANGEMLLIESNGESISFNGVNVIDPDRLANNGLIHGIDGVLAPAQGLGTLQDVIAAEDDLSTLAIALDKAGFYNGKEFDNANADPVTLCSPNDDAFDKLPTDRLDQLFEQQFVLHLRDVLEFHGVPGKVFAENVTNGLVAPTLNDQQLTFDFVTDTATNQTAVFIRTPNTEGSQVVEVNLEASNGIAHKIDALLLPDFWDKNLVAVIDQKLSTDTYSIFQELMAKADSDIQSTLTNFTGGTVLAPSNTAMLDAFGGADGVDALKAADSANELTTFLQRHIIPNDVLASSNIANSAAASSMTATNAKGEALLISSDSDSISFNGVSVVDPDQLANNGLIHGINGVLTEAQGINTLQDVIAAENDLSSLALVLDKAGFYDGEFDNANASPVTLCSPNDDAFQKLPSDRLIQLLDEQFLLHLRDVLEFHGVPGKVFAENVTNGLVAPTLNDEQLTFDFVTDTATNQTAVFIRTPNTEGSQVVEVNLEASNGIAHKIDALLLPDFWDKNLVSVIDQKLNKDEYSIFQELMAEADSDIQSTLSSFVGGTVLAPSNTAMLDAFGGADGVDALKGEDAALERAAFLKRHIIPNEVLGSINSASSMTATNANGEMVRIESDADTDTISFNGVAAVDANQLANNGLIHGIASVLTGGQGVSTLQDVIAKENDLSALAVVLDKAGFYNGEFDNANAEPVTLCSPNNDAFQKLPSNRLIQLLDQQFELHLRDVLEFHGVPGKVFAENVTNGLVAPTLNNEELTFDFVTDTATNQTSVFIRTPNTEGSQVVEVNLEASNGIAHKIDALLLPDFWDKNLVSVIDQKLKKDEYSIFQELMAEADSDIQSTLSNFVGGTVLAPSNTAMLNEFGGVDGVDALKGADAALERATFLKRHIIPNNVLASSIIENNSGSSMTATNSNGEIVRIQTTAMNGIRFNGVLVSDADQLANNGLIHGIDGVLPMGEMMPSPTTPPADSTTLAPNIVPTPTPSPTTSGAGLVMERRGLFSAMVISLLSVVIVA